jgi:hypothetical protein
MGETVSMSTNAHVRRSTVAAVAALVVAVPLTTATPAQASTSSSAPLASTRSFLAASAQAAAPKVPSNVRLVQTRTSLLGTHTWYRQVSAGRTVVNGWFVVHQWRSGKVTVDDYRKNTTGLVQDKNPITASTAVQHVRAVAAPAAYVSVVPRLMVLPAGSQGKANQVWRIVTTTQHGVTARYVDATNGRILRTDRLSKAADTTGTGRVFDPNPVVALQREDLRDRKDQNYPALQGAYKTVDLPRLDDSHSLVGQWVRIVNTDRATSPTDTYNYGRSNTHFEQVSAYYDLDTVQAYFQSIGFTNVNAESQKIRTNAFDADNSFYDPTRDLIATGTGGVDDAEDPEVTWHENGHAVQDDQIPGFGESLQSLAIGEGFGDYLAATMSQATAPDTETTPWACLMDWDSTFYTRREPHCIRRTDLKLSFKTDRTGEPHADGQIWSGALWRINKRLGRDIANQIILEAQFNFGPGIKMPGAARRTVATAESLFPGHPEYAVEVQKAFESRDII